MINIFSVIKELEKRKNDYFPLLGVYYIYK